ncbi:MAG TPA: NAD+ synthase [Streptosporangiaceae bacterium]|nr:NAD+ synthase [Streptosporangiaceae bacterium]
MSEIRIALAQVNSTVGDLDANAQAVIEWAGRAVAAGARVVVFPEMMLTGYPIEDLALRASFVDAAIAALERTAERLNEAGLGDIAVVVGYLDRKAGLRPRVGLPHGAPLDAAAVLHGGEVVVRSAKHHLPNYGVFDEFRYFVPGDVLPVIRVTANSGEPVDVAVAICEDLWQDGGPILVAKHSAAGLVVVPNASPYERGKGTERVELCLHRASEAGAALAYVNMVGGQDELVFDGDSIVVDSAGAVIARGPQFEQALVVVDLEVPAADLSVGDGDTPADAGDGTTMTIRRVTLPAVTPSGPVQAPEPHEPVEVRALWPRLDDLAEVYGALVLGTRDYVRKNGFSSVILALSGGIDSALTATIATDAIGADRVHVVLMPSKYSSPHSVTDAENLVKRQGVQARTVPIAPMVAAFDDDLHLAGLAEENLQARVRGMVLMSLSNAEGHLVLTTGNKSELATGYSTLYGDSAGGFAPIKDVPKTLVWELSKWRNRQAEQAGQDQPIPDNSITKPPSAELRPGQLDSDSLPDYAVLDAILDDYVEKDLGAAELVEAGHDPELVQRVIGLVDRAEYKRRQYPPGPKISAKNFGRDRRLPITNRWREPFAR